MLSTVQAIRFAQARLARLKQIRMELDDLPGALFGMTGSAYLGYAIDDLEAGIKARAVLLAEQARLPRKQPARAGRVS